MCVAPLGRETHDSDDGESCEGENGRQQQLDLQGFFDLLKSVYLVGVYAVDGSNDASNNT